MLYPDPVQTYMISFTSLRDLVKPDISMDSTATISVEASRFLAWLTFQTIYTAGPSMEYQQCSTPAK
jgi:hypothetical protein